MNEMEKVNKRLPRGLVSLVMCGVSNENAMLVSNENAMLVAYVGLVSSVHGHPGGAVCSVTVGGLTWQVKGSVEEVSDLVFGHTLADYLDEHG